MATSPPEDHRRISFLTKLVATGLSTGYAPVASGTVGTLTGIAIYLLPGFEQPLWMSLWILLGLVVGVFTSARVAGIIGNQLTTSAQKAKEIFQKESHASADPSIVVIDEIVGVWIALFLLPKSVTAIVIAFLAFRLFDIVKPFPAKQLEQLPNGWGIMLDDVAAGIYANLMTRVILYLFTYFSLWQ
jgi:phosphatidylglycerophosphatase A